MDNISSFLIKDHRDCDVKLARAEEAAGKNDWDTATSEFEGLNGELEAHFHMEEDVFFPAFEERTGNTMGPTAIMRQEHKQVRSLLADLDTAVTSRDKKRFLSASETLHFLIQQHNAKEEQILYAMGDRVLGDIAGELVEKMKKAASAG